MKKLIDFLFGKKTVKPVALDAQSARYLTDAQKNARYEDYLSRRDRICKGVYDSIKRLALEEHDCIIIHSDGFPMHWDNFFCWKSEELEWFVEDFKQEFESKGYTFDYREHPEIRFRCPRLRIGW